MIGTTLRKSRWQAALILPALFLAAAPAFAQSQATGSGQQSGDPVAEAARKAREAKQAAAKPKKVYTEDNLPKAPRTEEQPAPAGPTPDAQAGAPGAAGDPAAPGAAPDAKNDEAGWKARFKAQRDKIARAEKELDILQREVEKSQLQYYPDPQKAMSQQNSRKDINEKDAKIAAKKKEIETLKQGLDDLDDQLRKSGGDPGWARQ